MRRRRSSSSAYRPLVKPSPRSFSPLPFFYSPPVLITDLEDRRMFHPAGKQASAASLTRGARRVVARLTPGAPFSSVSARVGFAVPKQVAVCVRRKQRKEVLHAINFGGGGGARVSRRRRRNSFSEVDC